MNNKCKNGFTLNLFDVLNMKLLTLITFLLLQIPVIAQVGSNSKANVHFTQQTTRGLGMSVEVQVINKEESLKRNVNLYNFAKAHEKSLVKKQIERTLYELFDLKTQLQEDDLRKMKRDLNAMRQQKAPEDIKNIEHALQEIQEDITYRKNNRSEIVRRKMKELLEE